PQYGQYAPPQYPPPAAPPYGQAAPPQYPPPSAPQYGQYAPPPAAPQYGQYAPPPAAPQYGQYAPPSAPPGQPGWAPSAAPGGVPAYAAQGVAAPTAAGWAPPPKPGLIPLRPLGFGTLLGAPFQVLRRNPKATFGSGLLVQLAVIIVTTLFVGAAVVWAIDRSTSAYGTADEDAVAAGSAGIVVVSVIVPLALSLFASALLQAVLVLEVARATLGEKRRLGELWRAAFRRVLPLTGWFALIALAAIIVIAVFAGIIALGAVVGGAGLGVSILVVVLLSLAAVAASVWIGTKLALVPCIIVLERAPLRTALKRSWQLTQNSFWRTFGVIALVSVILSTAAQILQVPFSFLMPIAIALVDPNNSGTGIVAFIVLYLVFIAFSIVVGAVSAVVQAATVAVVYLDLRMRKEGLDIELVRYVESGGASAGAGGDADPGSGRWPDPYGTVPAPAPTPAPYPAPPTR
ncbi:MAG: glycerophosphoryl diester phosphodiesterase membrane domain-containing protein, partial [Herbiconiux sp.]|nr:glycerophosphoryl diester phosphodiesterase membrane domain-containing protein [Herbiconiux sp.]